MFFYQSIFYQLPVRGVVVCSGSETRVVSTSVDEESVLAVEYK